MFGYGGARFYYASKHCYICKGTGTDPQTKVDLGINMPCEACNGTGVKNNPMDEYPILWLAVGAVVLAIIIVAATVYWHH